MPYEVAADLSRTSRGYNPLWCSPKPSTVSKKKLFATRTYAAFASLNGPPTLSSLPLRHFVACCAIPQATPGADGGPPFGSEGDGCSSCPSPNDNTGASRLHGLRRHSRHRYSCAQRHTSTMKDEPLASANAAAHAPSPIDVVRRWAPSLFCSAELRPTLASDDLHASIYVQAAYVVNVRRCP